MNQQQSHNNEFFLDSAAQVRANQRKGRCAAAPWRKIPAPEGLELVHDLVVALSTSSEFSSLLAEVNCQLHIS
jgi:hypothetical protein